MTVVDAHVHVFKAVSDRYPRAVHALHPAEREATAEELIASMERASIDRAVLVGLSPHDEYLAECVAERPDTFAAVAIQDPDDVSLESLARRRDLGIDGLRLFALGDPAVADVEALPAFRLLTEMAATRTKLWLYAPREQLPLLERVLEALPDLTVVLNHLGFCPGEFSMDGHGRPRFAMTIPPDTLGAVTALSRFDHVHVMFSGEYAFSQEGYPHDDLRPVVSSLLAAFGARRLLRATDWPWIAEHPGYGETFALADRLLPGLHEDERAAIRGENAERLFWSVPTRGGSD
jgi:L-fuconolactonase